jgi:hypothetical protein
MNTHREAMPVCLKTVTQAWLYDTLASLDFVQESVNIGDDIIVHLAHMDTQNSCQKHSTEPGHRVNR